jgi:hypothetical protein
MLSGNLNQILRAVVSIVVNIQITIFWYMRHVIQCQYVSTNVSEEIPVSIFRESQHILTKQCDITEG